MFLIDGLKVIPGETRDALLRIIAIDLPEFTTSDFNIRILFQVEVKR